MSYRNRYKAGRIPLWAVLFAFVVVAATAGITLAQGEIGTEVLSSGGRQCQSASLVLKHTAAQGPIGPVAVGSTMELQQGFWHTIVESVGPCEQWGVTLTISGSGITQYRVFGEHCLGTEDYDSGLDVIIPPPGFTFYSYLRGKSPYSYLSTSIKASEPDSINWLLSIINADDFTVSWNTGLLPCGYALTIDGVDMRSVDHIDRVYGQTLEICANKAVEVLAPNDGETWFIGSGEIVLWNAPGLCDITIDLSRNGVDGPWELLFDGISNDGSEPWTVSGPTSDSCYVRVSVASDGEPYDLNDFAFSISPQAAESLRIAFPNGGEIWECEGVNSIEWISNNRISDLTVDLSRTGPSGPWESLFACTGNDSIEPWVAFGPTSDDCYIRICDCADGIPCDVSDSAFAIVPTWLARTDHPLGHTGRGRGVAWGDYDNNGFPDLYVSNHGEPNILLANNGDGSFSDVTAWPLDNNGNGRGVAWGDYDNDGYLDLYLGNQDSQNRLFHNEAGVSFTDATTGALADSGWTMSIAWADYDNDGLLDLYLAQGENQPNRLLRNMGAAGFSDVTSPPLDDSSFTTGIAWGDYDNDGDLDLYIGNYGDTNRLFQNEGDGGFTDVTSGALADAGYAMGVAWADYDNDNDLDLYIVNSPGENKLLKNAGPAGFQDVTSPPVNDAECGTGIAWADYDNDGDLDIYLANYQAPNKLFRNDGPPSWEFSDATAHPLDDDAWSYGVAWADYDNDGDVDGYLANSTTADKLFHNSCQASGNHWVQVRLVGSSANTFAIGARVRIVAGGISQTREISGGSGFASQNSLVAEFGLGPASLIDTLEIHWPSICWPRDSVQRLLDMAVDQVLLVNEADRSAVGNPSEDQIEYRLHPTFPNPTVQVVTIYYDVPAPGLVDLSIYDVTGRVIRVIVTGEVKGCERHSAEWDGRDDLGNEVSPGVYFVRFRSRDVVQTQRIVLMR